MKSKGNAVIIVLIVVIVAFSIGLFAVLKPSTLQKIVSKQHTNSSSGSYVSQPLQLSGNRVKGNSKLIKKDGYEEIDTAYLKDSIKGSAVGSKGTVVTSTLKSGVPVHLVIPPNSGVTSAEIAEYNAMPMASDHLPLYPDLGFGMNIALEGPSHGTQYPVYLVIDYSKGKLQEEFSNLTKKNNRCDFTKPLFNAEVCAMALQIPMGKTIGSKYMAVSPRWAGNTNPTFPIYSYYLGHNDLLVLRLYESTIVIPQPQTEELAKDLISSTFHHYSIRYEGYEAIDLLRRFNLTISDTEVLQDLVDKSYFEDPKVMFAYPAIHKAIEVSGDTQMLQNFDTKKSTFIAETLKAISGEATANRSNNLISSANLQRAIQSKVKGSKKVGTQVLTTIHQQFQEDSYTPVYAEVLEGIYILTNKVHYAKQTASVFHIGQVFAQDDSDATIIDDGDGTIIDDSYGEGTEADAEAYDQAVDQAAKDAENAARNEANDIANDPDASVEDLLRAAALDQLIGDDDAAQKLLDRALEKIKQDMKEDEENGDDDQFVKDAEACMLLGGSDSECKKEKVRTILLTLCQRKVESKNLHNFADEDVEPINCERDVVGTAE